MPCFLYARDNAQFKDNGLFNASPLLALGRLQEEHGARDTVDRVENISPEKNIPGIVHVQARDCPGRQHLKHLSGRESRTTSLANAPGKRPTKGPILGLNYTRLRENPELLWGSLPAAESGSIFKVRHTV